MGPIFYSLLAGFLMASFIRAKLNTDPGKELGVHIEDVHQLQQEVLNQCRIKLTILHAQDRCRRITTCFSGGKQIANDKCTEALDCYQRLPLVERTACPTPERPECYSPMPCGRKQCTVYCSGNRTTLFTIVSSRTQDLANAAITAGGT